MIATPRPLSDLGLPIPVLAAPMAGGPTTPALVLAAADAGGLGFLAGGYKSAAALRDQVDEVRARTSAYGVNLFAPNPLPVDRAEYDSYRRALSAEAERFGVTLPETPVDDDDAWHDKVELLVELAVPVVSFTFGVPDAGALNALRRAGSLLVQTVTSVDEARLAAEAGIDALAVQASVAGGHSGTFTPRRLPEPIPLVELIAAIRHTVALPVVAAGGLVDASGVEEAVRAGADAVAVGTVLLLAPECGTSTAHRAALTGDDRGETVVTRAFTGRPARALRNTFIDAHNHEAPTGYPALHHLTSPMRRAAAAAGDPEYVNLWAGAGYRSAQERSAADILRDLAAKL